MGGSFEREVMKGASVDIAIASCTLQMARRKSALDGYWRILLTPNDTIGKMLIDTIEACSGSGRTEVFASGGKVSVTSDPVPFGDASAILIPIGIWDTDDAYDILTAWERCCKGVDR